MNILISACLLGAPCRYNGEGQALPGLDSLMARHRLIPFCPEVYGGLPTPREPSEIRGGRVCTQTGRDVTAQFERGAEEALRLARLFQCECALLKERSPSCGFGEIYDGTFSGRLTGGSGVTAGKLSAAGIPVLGESRLAELL